MIGKAFEAGIYILAQYATCFAFHKDCFARLSQSASNFSDFLSIIISQCKVKKSFQIKITGTLEVQIFCMLNL